MRNHYIARSIGVQVDVEPNEAGGVSERSGENNGALSGIRVESLSSWSENRIRGLSGSHRTSGLSDLSTIGGSSDSSTIRGSSDSGSEDETLRAVKVETHLGGDQLACTNQGGVLRENKVEIDEAVDSTLSSIPFEVEGMMVHV